MRDTILGHLNGALTSQALAGSLIRWSTCLSIQKSGPPFCAFRSLAEKNIFLAHKLSSFSSWPWVIFFSFPFFLKTKMLLRSHRHYLQTLISLRLPLASQVNPRHFPFAGGGRQERTCTLLAGSCGLWLGAVQTHSKGFTQPCNPRRRGERQLRDLQT